MHEPQASALRNRERAHTLKHLFLMSVHTQISVLYLIVMSYVISATNNRS